MIKEVTLAKKGWNVTTNNGTVFVPFDYEADNELNKALRDWFVAGNKAMPRKKTVEEKIDDEYNKLSAYIYKYFPQVKQNSDLADKIFFENVLKANGYKNIEKDVVRFVVEFKNGKRLKDILKNIEDKYKEGIVQLIKVGIRVDWVQQCKKELKEALKEGREPNYPKYPL